MNKTIELLVKLSHKAIKENGIPSVVVGNALFLSKSTSSPNVINLVNSDYYLKNGEDEKKEVTKFLEKMKFPNFNFNKELAIVLEKFWVNKTKKAKEEKIINNEKIGTSINNKKKILATKKSAPIKNIGVEVVIKKKRLINNI